MPNFIPLTTYRKYPENEMKERVLSFYEEVRRRRTVRQFSDRAVPREIIEHAVLAAGTAPNGANIQPWHFVVITNAAIKRQIRVAAEKEEHDFYTRRATPEWLEDLAILGTDENKPFLETAPYLIAIFEESYRVLPDGSHRKNYYVSESTGIATGILITALHHAGLATLTHTPSPMGFLNDIVKRPKNEKPFLILVVGFPAENATVPDIHKKELNEITSFI
ncbi:MAG: nitroreductase family protein [Anaerolineales bacterium]|nr:nitroreductase family protein [Anaerolineales bacterium]